MNPSTSHGVIGNFNEPLCTGYKRAHFNDKAIVAGAMWLSSQQNVYGQIEGFSRILHNPWSQLCFNNQKECQIILGPGGLNRIYISCNVNPPVI